MTPYSRFRPGSQPVEHTRHEFHTQSGPAPTMRQLREGKAFALKMITQRPMTETEIMDRAKAAKDIVPVAVIAGITALVKNERIMLKGNRYIIKGKS